MAKKIKITLICLAGIGALTLLAFFLLGTFFDHQISNWFTPGMKHNFFGLFFEMFGMGVYTLPALAIVIVFFNWLIFTKKQKISKSILIPVYVFIVLVFLVLDSISIFKGGDNFTWMVWTINLEIYLILYGCLFFYFYHPYQIKKFKQNYYRLQSLIAMVIYILLAYLTVVILKIIFVRPRMEAIIEGSQNYRPWWKIIWKPYQFKNNSFPSGHTAIALSLLSFLFLGKKDNWLYLILAILFWAVIVVIGVSRIVYLKHFLTDVVAAMMVGSAWFYFGNWINQQKWMQKWEVK